jgi:peptidoglycan/xylan/chitin deacetylase (PgdA/CDA1 family)
MRLLPAAAERLKLCLRMRGRPGPGAWPGGVVSFTFDDFPKSAATTGASILERYDARGTYYVSMGLAATERETGPMFDLEDIRALYRAGHEIACHTHTHLDCAKASRRAIVAAVRRNAAALACVVPDFVPANFAYPYGSVSPAAKRVLRSRFASCRGIRRGINHGIIDRADLVAIAIYDCCFAETEMYRLIDQNTSVGGWLVFYTHDIVDTPSRFGCTPAQLKAIVGYARKRAQILPVRQVVAALQPFRGIDRFACGHLPGTFRK